MSGHLSLKYVPTKSLFFIFVFDPSFSFLCLYFYCSNFYYLLHVPPIRYIIPNIYSKLFTTNRTISSCHYPIDIFSYPFAIITFIIFGSCSFCYIHGVTIGTYISFSNPFRISTHIFNSSLDSSGVRCVCVFCIFRHS